MVLAPGSGLFPLCQTVPGTDTCLRLCLSVLSLPTALPARPIGSRNPPPCPEVFQDFNSNFQPWVTCSPFLRHSLLESDHRSIWTSEAPAEQSYACRSVLHPFPGRGTHMSCVCLAP
ncbi:unnamed protein product [Gulo gulo]|uniref:Uncharacterized protein n=1 Tax=Gulo gulo TaxID=48420 RepID=A0A9X9Q583_GULGU|nr:unnamed protein product [Gulo gulo]